MCLLTPVGPALGPVSLGALHAATFQKPCIMHEIVEVPVEGGDIGKTLAEKLEQGLLAVLEE
ncbi:hypothetical protein N7454_003105 [Penicillium verhagenii]|nr:hypothetical protein N7454_003105 [Penicillium verhagenii]